MTPPPIGKAPNDGGGDLNTAKAWAREIRATNTPYNEYREENALLLERLVRRVEEAENCKACGGKDVVCAKAWEKERDTLKSKLSEAEKTMEELKGMPGCYRMVTEALSRLRADGGGRGEEKI